MMQICEGVHFMHSCNIIHLDMKVCPMELFNQRMKILLLAGEYSVFESKWSSDKNHRFWSGEKIRSNKTIKSSFRYTGIRRTRSD